MREPQSLLVVDVGTSAVRASVVDALGEVAHVEYERVLPFSPMPGFVEFDPARIASSSLEVAGRALERHGPVAGVGLAAQRASAVLWDRETGEPVAPGISWQDLRTVGLCLSLKEDGIRLAPNQTATKLAVLLDIADPERARDLCGGTIDSYLAFVLSGGALHVTDVTNAAVTGLVRPDATSYDDCVLERLRIPRGVLPTIVDSCGVVGSASSLPDAPPLAALIGDQQGSLVGQGCIRPGEAKITFGTGGMLDCSLGPSPLRAEKTQNGCFPIVTWSRHGELTWGLEAIVLSAGSCIEWLREDLGIISSPEETDELAKMAEDSGGVQFVPALFGLGTPVWDFGARGGFFGITRGTTRAELVRAVLEGIAQRGADLIEAVESDGEIAIETLHVDGGMSRNESFVQALADASGRAVAVSSVTEATALGAAFLAGVATGVFADLEEATARISPGRLVEPRRRLDRDRWLEARRRAERVVPELSALSF